MSRFKLMSVQRRVCTDAGEKNNANGRGTERGRGRGLFLDLENLLQNPDRVGGALHGVADRSRVLVDLIVVASLVVLVSKEVDRLEPFLFDVSESISLVPSFGATPPSNAIRVSDRAPPGESFGLQTHKTSNEI